MKELFLREICLCVFPIVFDMKVDTKTTRFLPLATVGSCARPSFRARTLPSPHLGLIFLQGRPIADGKYPMRVGTPQVFQVSLHVSRARLGK